MNKSESKYFNTASLMDQALICLLEKKPFEYITVKEVCEKAGVNRSTFYLHYDTMTDLASECMQNATRNMLEKFAQESQDYRLDIQSCPLEELNLITPKYLKPYLEFVRDNKNLFRVVTSQPMVFRAEQIFSEMNDVVFNPVFERYSVPDWERKYIISFYMNGIWAIIKQWLHSDCSDEIEKVMQLIISCANGCSIL